MISRPSKSRFCGVEVAVADRARPARAGTMVEEPAHGRRKTMEIAVDPRLELTEVAVQQGLGEVDAGTVELRADILQESRPEILTHAASRRLPGPGHSYTKRPRWDLRWIRWGRPVVLPVAAIARLVEHRSGIEAALVPVRY